jgi:hypothetical protein
MRRALQSLIAWAGFALLVWGAWLAFPRAQGGEPGPGLRVVLVDASASAVRRRPGWGSKVRALVREESGAAALLNQELSVVLVGRDVLRLRSESLVNGVGWLDPVLSGQFDGSATQLDEAIAGIEPDLMDDSRALGALVFVGDGEWSGADPEPRITRLARRGVECRRHGIGVATWPDLGLLDLRLPVRVASGESLAAECVLSYSPTGLDVSGELTLIRVDSSGRSELKLPLSLPTKESSWTVSVDLGPCADGPIDVEAFVRLRSDGALSSGDPVKENDRARARSRAGGLLLGLATASEERLDWLRAWLDGASDDGFHWEFAAPSDVAERLPGVDVLFSYDVSTASLPEEWLAPFLRRGGGWLAAGGWGLLADYWPRGVAGSAPASELLPLRPAQSEVPEREVIFCVDGSGSMSGEPFDSVRAALLELVRATLPSDQLKLRFFTGALGPEIDLGGGKSDRVEGMRRLLEARVPGGATAILSSMERFAVLREESDLPALILMLSDGMDDSAFDVEERCVAIRAAFAENRTELSVIAIGSDADLGLLGHLAGGEEELLVAEGLDELAELFRQEVAKERVRDGDRSGVVLHSTSLGADESSLARALEALGPMPGVKRLARMEARDGAAVLLRTEEDLPVLGLGRVGEGWAAVFPSLLQEGWARDYLDSAAFWSPLMRFLARRPDSGRGALRLDVEGDSLVLRLGDDASSWPAEVDVELFGVSRDGEPRVMGRTRLSIEAGGVAGVLNRRVGKVKFSTHSAGELWRSELRDPSSGEILAEIPLVAPLSEEFRPFRGKRLPEGMLGGTADVAPARMALAVGPLFVPVMAAALLLLAAAALSGRWRSSAL